ncbi:hypothetical protein HBB16_16930 [Pseudonocardia sp. MCCB 268]|nr:hypothetical protein [Pseudonocardia cytotoxica]
MSVLPTRSAGAVRPARGLGELPSATASSCRPSRSRRRGSWGRPGRGGGGGDPELHVLVVDDLAGPFVLSWRSLRARRAAARQDRLA